MINKENVIKALKCQACLDENEDACIECEYSFKSRNATQFCMTNLLCADACTLLEEYIEPIRCKDCIH
jgi:hypothetical protein